jgi:nucleotide-binding universal stress UspA family protein
MKAVQVKTRIALKNILFATDFSAAAEAAMPFAIQIAQRYGAKVYGVHVNSVINYTAITPGAWEAMAEAAEKEGIEDTQDLHKQLHGIEHEVLVAEGNTWEVVSNLVREKQIDLVVVGTRGRTGLGKALLGSVAEQILRQAPCPVLTVGPHVTLDPQKAAEMHQILYATDLAAEFPAAAPYAISLAQENQAHLTLLHVIPGPKTSDLVQPVQVAGSLERKLRQFVPQEDELWCEPVCLVEQGESAEKILDVAKRWNADLIVLGARPAKGMLEAATHLNGGTVHKVVLQAKCPVLTVRG